MFGKIVKFQERLNVLYGKLTASSFNSPTFLPLYFKIRPGDVHVELLVEPVESPLEAFKSLLEFVH